MTTGKWYNLHIRISNTHLYVPKPNHTYVVLYKWMFTERAGYITITIMKYLHASDIRTIAEVILTF